MYLLGHWMLEGQMPGLFCGLFLGLGIFIAVCVCLGRLGEGCLLFCFGFVVVVFWIFVLVGWLVFNCIRKLNI